MTLRRYVPMKKFGGTRIPADVRAAVYQRDWGCVGAKLGWPVHDFGLGLELDHVRASHGTGMKSETTLDNLIVLCGACHRWKTEHGREARPMLLAYLGRGQ